MEPLLEITTIPIDIQVNIKKATVEPVENDPYTPRVKVSRDRGEFSITAEPLKIQIDNSRMNSSIGLKRSDELIRENAQEGIQIAYQGVARIAREADLLGSKKATPASLAKESERAARTIETVTGWLPENGPDISWDGGTLNINYTADKLNMDWDVNRHPEFKFTPGSVEFIINQLPKVEIEYTGDPIYFPASANPNYEGE